MTTPSLNSLQFGDAPARNRSLGVVFSHSLFQSCNRFAIDEPPLDWRNHIIGKRRPSDCTEFRKLGKRIRPPELNIAQGSHESTDLGGADEGFISGSSCPKPLVQFPAIGIPDCHYPQCSWTINLAQAF